MVSIGLGGELVGRRCLYFAWKAATKRWFSGVGLADEPRAADDQPIRRGARDLAELRRVRAVAADEGGLLAEAELAGLQEYTGDRFDQRGDADGVRFQRLDLGELGREIAVLAAERSRW